MLNTGGAVALLTQVLQIHLTKRSVPHIDDRQVLFHLIAVSGQNLQCGGGLQ